MQGVNDRRRGFVDSFKSAYDVHVLFEPHDTPTLVKLPAKIKIVKCVTPSLLTREREIRRVRDASRTAKSSQ